MLVLLDPFLALRFMHLLHPLLPLCLFQIHPIKIDL